VTPMRLFRPKKDASGAEMPFLDHLEELRRRILWSLVALLAAACIGFWLVMHFNVLGLLIAPIKPYLLGSKLKYLGPTDPFFISFKLALVVGVLLALPIVVYQIWAFVSPAMLPHERKVIVPTLYLGLLLFLTGMALAYFFALPMTLKFMLSFQTETLEQNIVASAYLGFVVKLLLGFGAVFELPVVVLILSMLGIVNSKMLAAKRRHALVVNTILASVLTPGDVIVLTVFMMIPLVLLYEMSIALSKLVERRRARAEAGSLAEAS
jgi:sec-independent protein translocase protein TatC